ncbi:hypothetical protein ABEG18_09970 [Alsobacter sp. KACC 23698]|uniref:DUF1080 domain-containing protein n=1 Tax=Alsobacter sp. KACC 23698 TaxID=3149229 RepID=A0AAU7JL70_9HYPH
MRGLAASTLLAMSVGLAAGPALACKGKLIFSDNFREVDSSWRYDGDPSVSVEDGKVKVKPSANETRNLLYRGVSLDEAEICVTLKTSSDAPEAGAGILFWAQDDSNLYRAIISSAGTARISKLYKDKLSAVVDWTKFPAIKQGLGATNTLGLVTRGNSATFFINGEKFATVKGAQPEDGWKVGLYAYSEPTKVDKWKFSDVKVTELSQ